MTARRILWRYGRAIALTFAVAIVIAWLAAKALGIELKTLLSGANLIGVTVQRPIGSGSIAFIAAFLGIIAGSMCIARHSRIAACTVLTAMMVLVYQTLWFVEWRHEVPSKHGNSSLVLSIAAGGCAALAAVVPSARRKSKKAGSLFTLPDDSGKPSRVLDRGGKRSATPLSCALKALNNRTGIARSKALSPLRSASAVQNKLSFGLTFSPPGAA